MRDDHLHYMRDGVNQLDLGRQKRWLGEVFKILKEMLYPIIMA